MSIENAISKITGPVGTEVTLTVRHLGKNTMKDITVNRGRITTPIMTEYKNILKAYKAHKRWRE